MGIKLITIDFWNTMFDSSNGQLRNAVRLRTLVNEIDKFGRLVKQDEFETALKATWENFNSLWKNKMRTPLPVESVTFFWNFLKLPYNEESLNIVVKSFAESILEYPPKLIDGVRESLEILSNKYKLGVVSDTGFSPGTILKQLLINENIFEYFSAFSFSDETGVSKPHPDAFLTILNKTGHKPEEAVHIGDIEDTDIKGAKNLGMKAIKFIGDNTSLHDDKLKPTVADFEANSWEEIISFIDNS